MKIFSTFLLLLLPFSLFADDVKDTEWFVGLSAGATGANFSASDLNTSYAFGPEYGAKIGFRDKNSRVYLGYTIGNDIGSEISKTQSPYIALEGIGDEFVVAGDSTAKFYFGARIGASFATVNDTTRTAFLGGFQTGLTFLLPADFEIELEYRHYWSYRGDDADFNAGAAALALNYKFAQE